MHQILSKPGSIHSDRLDYFHNRYVKAKFREDEPLKKLTYVFLYLAESLLQELAGKGVELLVQLVEALDPLQHRRIQLAQRV